MTDENQVTLWIAVAVFILLMPYLVALPALVRGWMRRRNGSAIREKIND